MKNLNYYQILNIPYNATNGEIKSAYRKLLKKYHPDVYKMQDANKITSLINEAYLTLSNAENRIKYNSEIFPQIDNKFDLEGFFDDSIEQEWYEKNKTSVFNNIYGFGNENNKESEEYEFANSRYKNYRSFTEQIKFEDFEDEVNNKQNQKWNSYLDNAFDIKINKNIINKYCKAFEINWEDVLETLCETNLTLKEIFLRCYYNQHYFQQYKLTNKQLLAENVHKSILVHSEQYKRFIIVFLEEQKRLNLNASFYFDEVLLQKDFERIYRYYRLFECKFCSSKDENNRFSYCHFCFNKGYLKERMAILISWKVNSEIQNKIIIYKNFGNRNENFIGDLCLNLVPLKDFKDKNCQLLIDYKIEDFLIDEIEENKIL